MGRVNEKTWLWLVFLIILLVVAAGYFTGKTSKAVKQSEEAVVGAVPTVFPTGGMTGNTSVVPIKPVVNTTTLKEATNSVGNLVLAGSKVSSGGAEVRYDFRVIDKDSGTAKELFSQTVNNDTAISIPFNSWSPDNKQIFLKVADPKGTDYWVLKVDGSNYADGERYLSVMNYWNKAERTYKVRIVSGWAGDGLLQVYTLKGDGSEGPLYWFLTGSKTFEQLAR